MSGLFGNDFPSAPPGLDRFGCVTPQLSLWATIGRRSAVDDSDFVAAEQRAIVAHSA
jgi:hypothetical protein